MTYNGSQMQIIRDGLDAGSVAKSGDLRENNWIINIGNNPGSNDQNAYSWDGKIDEVRISSMARSLDWMKTEYRNQGSPGTYQTIGRPGNSQRSIDNPYMGYEVYLLITDRGQLRN